jgi:hypothetical protein
LRSSRRKCAAHLLQLCAGGHLLGEQSGLDAVEETLQPADELGLGDPELGIGRDRVVAEPQSEPCRLNKSEAADE